MIHEMKVKVLLMAFSSVLDPHYSLKRTWKPRSLSGEETFSRPEAGPGCDTMGACH